jgi:hypothetical protein
MGCVTFGSLLTNLSKIWRPDRETDLCHSLTCKDSDHHGSHHVVYEARKQQVVVV